MTNESITREERMEKYTGKIFVVLKRDDHMGKVIESIGDNYIVRFGKTFLPCCFDKTSLWAFYRAPEPSDINWQNLGVGPVRRVIQTGFVWLITGIILTVCALAIEAIKNYQIRVKEENKGKVLSFEEK